MTSIVFRRVRRCSNFTVPDKVKLASLSKQGSRAAA